MAISDWDWRYPVTPQDYPWDCAAASTAWALNTVGLPYTEQQVIAGMGRHRITPTWGLMDASGAGIVEWLAEIGVTAFNDGDASFQEVMDAAGHQPMVMGGREWNHWVGVRMGSAAVGRPDLGLLAVANTADGYMGIGQWMNSDNFWRLGPFSAVWLTAWPQPK